MIKNHQDAFGHLMMDYHLGKRPVEIIERDDGNIETSSGPGYYFSPYESWIESTRRAADLARGRCLDVGCGAGRVALHLQNKGLEVVAIDNSPLAVEVCRLRGVRDARCLSLAQVNKKLGVFDSILMFGSNLSLLGDRERAPKLLNRLAAITNPGGLIIGQTRDPYHTTDPDHLAYHEFNRQRGRAPGQVRIRVRHRKYKGPWFDYLFVSQDELLALLEGTPWRAVEIIERDDGVYFAVLRNEKS